MAEPHRSVHRQYTAVMFDRSCVHTGLSTGALIDALAQELGRDGFSRGTISAWRRGAQAVPADVLSATMKLGGVWSSQLAIEILPVHPELKKALAEPERNPERARMALAVIDALWPPAGDNTPG